MRGTVVTDTFNRTVSSGWGSTDTGQAYSQLGSGGTVALANWNVTPAGGTHSVPATNAYRLSYLSTFSQSYVDLSVTGSVNATASGAPIELANLLLRGTSSTSYYMVRVRIETTQALTLLLISPTGATLGTVPVPGITYTSGLTIRVRVQAAGQTIRAKVWPSAGAEPAGWMLSLTDATYTGAGWVGVRSGVAAGNTNTLPLTFTYDDLAVVQMPDYPADPLPVQVLAAFGADLSANSSTWTWTDITADVLARTISITQGRADDTSQASPAGCTLQLDNTAMSYSAYNSASPNWPNVKRNTPIWVTVTPHTRFFGYANGWTPGWDVTGKVATVTLSASGILRRLTQGKTPLRSPLYRAITARPELRAYWPLEDTAGSTSAASAMPGGPAMTAVGLTFGADSSEPGSAPLPTFGAASSLYGAVTGSFAGRWQLDWYYKIPADIAPAESTLIGVSTTDVSGSAGMRWGVTTGGAATSIRVQGINSVGTVRVDSGYQGIGSAYFGTWVHGRLMVQQSGGNIAWQCVVFPLSGGSGLFFSGTVAGTVGAVTSASIPTDSHLSGLAVGHIAVLDAYNLGAADQAQTGFTGELVTTRLARLCAEQGVPITITGTSTTTMGPQSVDTFVNLLRECEQADLGLLYDGRSSGLGYVTRDARYNQAAGLTLDMAAQQVAAPFAPVDDDQRNRNSYQVERKGGSSATYEDTTSTLGTDPVIGIGVYDSSVTINVDSDGPLGDYASWLVHLGTVPGFRYPTLGVDLTATGSPTVDDWASGTPNGRIDVLNVQTAAGHAPGTVSLLREGYTETLTQFHWTATANCSPYSPHRVFALAAESGDTSEYAGRLDTDGSTLAVALATTGGRVQVTSTPFLWTAAADDLPYDIAIDGEQMRVTAVDSAINTNPYLEIDASDWAATGTGVTVARSTAQAHQGTASLLITTPGGVASLDAHTATRYLAVPGTSYTASAWVYLPNAWTDVRACIDWYNGGAFLSSSLGVASSVPAATWTFLSQTFTAPFSATGAVLRLRLGGTPGSTISVYGDEIKLTNAATQVLTVTRSVNGVVRTHAAGAAVSLWQPLPLAL